MQETRVLSLGWGDPLEEEMAFHSSIFLPGKFSRQRSLVGYSPLDHKESDMTEWLSTVQFSRSVVSDSLRLHGLQHARLLCPSPTLRACSNTCPLSRWCHLTILSFVIPAFVSKVMSLLFNVLSKFLICCLINIRNSHSLSCNQIFPNSNAILPQI